MTEDGIKPVRCRGCFRQFERLGTRGVVGGGHSPLIFFNNPGAAADAERRAQANLKRMLDEAIEAVPCPGCGRIHGDRLAAQIQPRLIKGSRRGGLSLTTLLVPTIC